MKKNNRSGMRKGFTLVELLIVIVVIGILSAMMMLSSTEAVTSAKASNIVSNMRNLKTAALAYYVDNLDTFSTATITALTEEQQKGVLGYLNNKDSIKTEDGYSIDVNTTNGNWYVKYNLTKAGSSSEQKSIRGKLHGRATSIGLLAGNDNDAVIYTGADTGADNVYMRVR